MKLHDFFMQRALNLARLSIGSVAPNPMVGCVIVQNNIIIGEGFHQKYGGPHAEVMAVAAVKNKALIAGATVYVNLEPCAHFGKTPPCADLLIENKVAQVIISNTDPNPLVAGKGIEKLQKAGIEVVVGILEKEGLALNKRFFTFFEKRRPFIILKWAQTNDGYIAEKNGQPIQISNPFSTKIVHKMRAENAAIMVGTTTIFNDNPSLTTRNWTGSNPIRVLIDKQLRFKQHLNIFNSEAETLIYNLHGDGKVGQAEYIKLPEDEAFLQNLLQNLFLRNVNSIMVEGGTKLLEAFINMNLWDEAKVIVSPKKINSGIKGPAFDFSKGDVEYLETDKIYSVKNPKAIA
jgi:diaminohydroxyphosphoribosylaminopyrimidine deaminase / 5-amino-6-(5-phosphoribosylamino)uracil reductase